MARPVGMLMRTLAGQVGAAAVTTVSLSVGFMVFNDYFAPVPDLSGRWKFTVVYEDTALPRFEGLKVTYQVLLVRERLDLSGSGEKLSDQAVDLERVDYDSGRGANIEVMGNVTRKLLLAGRAGDPLSGNGPASRELDAARTGILRRGHHVRVLPVDDFGHAGFGVVGAGARARRPPRAGRATGRVQGHRLRTGPLDGSPAVSNGSGYADQARGTWRPGRGGEAPLTAETGRTGLDIDGRRA